ncbi:MAG: sulfotransferase family protein [Terriglobia bacterium]
MNSFVTVVSGVPRSGTSLMMQMLGAGGLPLLTDGVRLPDKENPRGYFEFEAVKRTARDSTWVNAARGRAVKVIYALLRDLPPEFEYRVIFMHRDLREVAASQRAMLMKLGAPGAGVDDTRIASIFEVELAATLTWLSGRANFSLLQVDYRQSLEKPQSIAAAVNQFLDGGLDEAQMAAVVDPALYRHRGQY